MDGVTTIPALIGQAPFLITVHSGPMGIDTRTDFEKDKRMEEFVGFYLPSGKCVHLLHHQDCCETVTLLESEGDIRDLTDQSILLAEESFETHSEKNDDGSSTWSFYRFATKEHGFVVLRFYGSSNGYYSESVSVNENIFDFSLVLQEKARREKDALNDGLEEVKLHKPQKSKPKKI